ncbi:MAG: chromosomal replication initiator protein DnaA [Candidatus Marinimicrobia bacterium]|nr:chromosomal replication initiator protein DnaA [Candidatus Neomarinimicrobiota bacterium]
MTHIDLWKTIKKSLKKNHPQHAFSTWFEPITSIGLSNDELILEVPNQFFFEWIQSHYKESIQKWAVEVYGELITIKYTVSPEGSKQPPQKEIAIEEKYNGAKKSYQRNNINRHYTFASFIEGAHNQFAKAAALSTVGSLGQKAFNPLVIYGGVGMGKTHLLHAIGNKIIQEQQEKEVVCASSEKFTLDFISSIQKNRTVEFSKSYRKADILLIDDIQFFQGKEQTQEQFFHTFNELFHRGKQIVMTADRYPGEMVGLQDRLLSRFKSGLSVDIQPPDFETRVAIVMEKAEKNGLKLSYDIIELIGTHIKKNVRDLESTIIRLLAHSSLSNKEIDYALTKKVIKERLGKSSITDLTVEDIVRRVSETTHIKEREIVGASRKMEITEARQISIYLCREILGTPLVSIGIHFGGRDHSTVLHACRVIGEKTKKNHRIGTLVGELKNELSFALN